jgi:hypothetical protein
VTRRTRAASDAAADYGGLTDEWGNVLSMTERRRSIDPADETSGSSEWQRLDAMLDEAGRESFPASDPPALIVDGPLTTAQPDENSGSSARGGHEGSA